MRKLKVLHPLNSKVEGKPGSASPELQNRDVMDSGEKNSVKQTPDFAVSKEKSAVVSPKMDGVLSEGWDVSGIQRPSIQESKSNEGSVVSTNSQATSDVGRQTPSPPLKTSLDDNIVLGVALEGSKMMLPIEDELMPPPTPSEVELASHWNGNGLVTVDKQDDSGEAPSRPL